MSILNTFNVITIVACMAGVSACGQAPQGLTSLDSPTVVAAQPIVVSPSPTPSATPSTVPLIYYAATSTQAPLNGFPSKTYTATGYCVVYKSNTYCWDNGIKVIDFTINSFRYGPFNYTYFNMSRDVSGWSHASGGLQQDLMSSPTLVDSTLSMNMASNAVNTVFTTGTGHNVDCTETDDLLDCGDFTIDLSQTAL